MQAGLFRAPERLTSAGFYGCPAWWLLFLLKKAVVLLNESLDLVGGYEELFPLFFIECDGKAAQAVNRNSALLTDFEGHLSAQGSLQGRILGLESLNFC